MAYRLSSSGYADLLRTEGNRRAVYDDYTSGPINSYEEARGTPTIGLGLAIQSAADREKFRPYLGGVKAPQEFIDAENQRKIGYFERALNSMLGSAKVTEAMFDALFSLAWNAGEGSYAVKNAVAAILRRDYKGAQKAIAEGPTHGVGKGYMPELAARRQREAAAFMSQGLPGAGAAPVVIAATLAGVALLGTLAWVYREPLRARVAQLRG